MIEFDLKNLKVGQAVLLKRWSPDKYDLIMIKLTEEYVLGKGYRRNGTHTDRIGLEFPTRFGMDGVTECYEYVVINSYFDSLMGIIDAANKLENE